MGEVSAGSAGGRRQALGLLLGFGLFFLLLLIPELSVFHDAAQRLVAEQGASLDPSVLGRSMQCVAALALLMIVLWLTEGVPLPVTGLLPLVVLPLLHLTGLLRGVPVGLTLGSVAAGYASPVIYLFLGSFLLAGALQKWGIDRRLTLWILTRGRAASGAPAILLAVMAVTAFLSMWISNTATAAMMLPLGLGILATLGCAPGSSRFGTALMLGIAWSGSIGGIGTIIGTPPNGIALGILNTAFANDPSYQRLSFIQWMSFGVPYVILFLPVAWLLLLKVFPPEIKVGNDVRLSLQEQYRALGPLVPAQKRSIAVFVCTAILWIALPFREAFLPAGVAQGLEWFDEYAVGILGGVSLFFLPSGKGRGGRLMTWDDTGCVEWGTLLLFGGGIALSDAMFKTGLAFLLSTSFIGSVGSSSPVLMLGAVTVLSVMLTEVASNTAVSTMLVPIVITLGRSVGADPVTLAVGCAIAASLAFMLPVSTPPNALVYGTGYVRIRDMVRGGVLLDLIGCVCTVLVLILIGSYVFGVLRISF
jgi:sodium-dependent dicarboxylate transporter 2/3/5